MALSGWAGDRLCGKELRGQARYCDVEVAAVVEASVVGTIEGAAGADADGGRGQEKRESPAHVSGGACWQRS